MEKIIIKGLKLFAYHGVNPEEKENGQNFVFDIIAELNADVAKESDNIDDTVSYAKIIKTVKAVFTEDKYDLLETVANKVGKAIMDTYPAIQKLTVLLMKPEAPINADFEYVAVEETLVRE